MANLRFCGYIAIVKVKTNKDETDFSPPKQTYDITDQADGGAHSLNINRSVHLFLFCQNVVFTCLNISIFCLFRHWI